MKITLKTLKGQQLPLDVETTMTVGALKQLIQTTHGQPAETQKLIAYGKVMDDEEKTVADYKIVENGFIVMMTVKAKPVKPAATEDSKMEDVAQPGVTLPAQAAADAQANPAPATTTSANPPSTAPTQVQPPVAQPNAGGLPPGVDEEAVSTLVAITNKPRDLCIQALAMTKNNADLACSILLEGVDMQQLQALAAQHPGGLGAPGGGQGFADYGDEDDGYGQDPSMGGMVGGNMGGAPGGGQGQIDPNLAAFLNNQDFAMMAQRMRENPSFYQDFINRAQQENPQLFNAIQSNQGAFMNAVFTGNPNLGLPTGANAGGAGMPGGGMGAGMPGAGAGQPGQPRAPGNVMQVTPEQLQAIERLQSLGFSQQRAAEAYFACDKNEEFAANFLFESAFEDDNANMNQAVAQSQADAGQAQPVVAAEAQQPVASDAQPQPEAQAEAQANPDAQQQQEAQPEAQQQPAADSNANAQPPNNDGNNNNGGNGNGEGGDAGAGAGAGGEESAFQ